MPEKAEISPIVKWAGGKRQLLDRIIERSPKEYEHYFEPFIGGGAVLFGIQPKKATINDINKELINLYLTVKKYPKELLNAIEELDRQECDKEFYYKQRAHYNDKLSNGCADTELAALFVWLNKHCFNGLYRVNGQGKFNVPWNSKSKTTSVQPDNVIKMSEFLQNVEILLGDFEIACSSAKKGDFVFFDSPYAPINDTSFEAYTKEGFAEEEHIRLSKLFKRLSDRGCFCMLTNHDTPLIRSLYQDYPIEIVDVKRLINRNANSRTGTEVIIKNY